ncbi:MAG: PHP domain-containing protein [Acidobacteriota bacterium]
MDIENIDLKTADLHLHTIASDGEMTAEEVIDTSAELGLKTISITDHDGVGAYAGGAEILIDKARSKGVELITGTELDSEYMDVEVHILGYGIEVDHPVLKAHLAEIHPLRRKRIREIVAKVNDHFGTEFLKEEEIFPAGRETLMKPHVVRELLDKGKFDKYRDAARWISEKCRSETVVPKFSPEKIISVILGSGGVPVLAHPAYYSGVNGVDLDKMISDFSAMGLSGVEVYYDYHGLSPALFNMEDGADISSVISNITKKHGLFSTRGSDSHTLEELVERNHPEKTG